MPRQLLRFIQSWINRSLAAMLIIVLIAANIVICLFLPIFIPGLSSGILFIALACSVIVSSVMIVVLQRDRSSQVTQAGFTAAAFAELLPVMFLALDSSGTLVAWNHESERVTGFSAAEMVGNPRWRELVNPDPKARAAAQAS